MQPTTQERHRRKIFGGLALIVAPLLMGVAFVIAPASSSDTTEAVTAMAEGSGRVEIASIVLLAGIAAFVYAVLALVHLLREQQPWFGQIGGGLAVAGLVFFAGMVGLFITVTELAKTDLAGAATLMERMEENPALIIAFVGSSLVTVGLVLLAVGLLRARTAPVWSAWLLIIGALAAELAGWVDSDLFAVVGMGIVFLALAPLGYELIVEPDEAWEHPAQFEGFRPVVGAH